MAFLDILNIPGLLGTELHTFKRANVYDKLDLGLAGVVALLAGVVLLLNGLVANKRPENRQLWKFFSQLSE